MLAEAKSEIMKQECEVDSLSTCIRELQRQTHSQRLGLDDVNCGYEESRREQVRLEEELALRTCELTNSLFNKLRESHAAIREPTSQIQDLQERVNCMNDPREFQDIESICSGKIISRSQSTGGRSKSLWNAEPRPKHAT